MAAVQAVAVAVWAQNRFAVAGSAAVVAVVAVGTAAKVAEKHVDSSVEPMLSLLSLLKNALPEILLLSPMSSPSPVGRRSEGPARTSAEAELQQWVPLALGEVLQISTDPGQGRMGAWQCLQNR